MNAKELWQEFCRKTAMDEATPYDDWAFGSDPDGLASLVLQGIKTATASAAELYALESEALPEVGCWSVLLDSQDEALCILRDTKVTVAPFSEVTEEQAWKEGEGDRTLAYWREVHRRFFTEELAEAGLIFREDMPVVCEEFEVVYRTSQDSNHIVGAKH